MRLASLIAGTEIVSCTNNWSFADYSNQPNGRVDVPTNNWGGNAPENTNFAPREEKRPDDLRYFGNPWGAFDYRVPGNDTEQVKWHHPLKREENTIEEKTTYLDADGNPRFARKVHQFNTDYWEFAQTETEKEAGWERGANKCGQKNGIPQQDDPNCPNVIIINTDDLAWADISINNPSKVVPTPNLDRLVSKGESLYKFLLDSFRNRLSFIFAKI